MLIEYDGRVPEISPDAYVAPNATVRGDVRIGPGSVVLFGAVLTDEGGSVEIGSDCVIMENAVLRGGPKHPLRVGNQVLVGPHAHVIGCTVEDDCFIATGASVFNGARLASGVELRINAVVHVNSRVAAGTVVPIAWVAVGDPAEIHPPSEHDAIWRVQQGLDFPGTVWGTDRSVSQGKSTRRFARKLMLHKNDHVVGASAHSLTLREVQQDDLSVFFDQQLDPEANKMAAFTSKDPTDQKAFAAHWARILADDTVTVQTIVLGQEIAGHIARFEREGQPEITYWIGREHWGKGVATRALSCFLSRHTERPIHARVAKDNVGSVRVLEKCGFTVCGEEEGFANARGKVIEELVMVLTEGRVTR